MKGSRKFPLFIGAYGEVGSFIEAKREMSDSELIHVIYLPLNRVFRSVTTPYAIREKALVRVPGNNGDVEGSFSEYVIAVEDVHGNSPFFGRINREQQETIAEYQEKLKDEKFASRVDVQKLKETKDSIDRQKYRQMERQRQRIGGMYPSFGSRFIDRRDEIVEDDLNSPIEDI